MKKLFQNHYLMLIIIVIFILGAYISTLFDLYSTEWAVSRTVAYSSILIAGLIAVTKPELLFKRKYFKSEKSKRQHNNLNKILGIIWLVLAIQAIYSTWAS